MVRIIATSSLAPQASAFCGGADGIPWDAVEDIDHEEDVNDVLPPSELFRPSSLPQGDFA